MRCMHISELVSCGVLDNEKILTLENKFICLQCTMNVIYLQNAYLQRTCYKMILLAIFYY